MDLLLDYCSKIMVMSSYKDLLVWQKSLDLCQDIYTLTDKYPKSEQFGLTSQIRRAAVSIPSNISEGQKRGHKAEFLQFCRISYASTAELDTQLLLSKRLGYITDLEHAKVDEQLQSIAKMLNKLLSSLGDKSKT